MCDRPGLRSECECDSWIKIKYLALRFSWAWFLSHYGIFILWHPHLRFWKTFNHWGNRRPRVTAITKIGNEASLNQCKFRSIPGCSWNKALIWYRGRWTSRNCWQGCISSIWRCCSFLYRIWYPFADHLRLWMHCQLHKSGSLRWGADFL